MPVAQNLLQSIVVIVGLIGLVQYLRHIGLLRREHAGLRVRDQRAVGICHCATGFPHPARGPDGRGLYQ